LGSKKEGDFENSTTMSVAGAVETVDAKVVICGDGGVGKVRQLTGDLPLGGGLLSNNLTRPSERVLADQTL
jgi:hypothetical protein